MKESGTALMMQENSTPRLEAICFALSTLMHIQVPNCLDSALQVPSQASVTGPDVP